MSASTRRSSLCPPRRLHGSASVTPHDDPERLRWLIRRIADDDHDAFTELFDRCSGLMSRLWTVRYRIGIGPQAFSRALSSRCGGSLAAMPIPRPMSWHGSTRSSSGASRTTGQLPASANPAPPGLSSLDAPWTQGVEVELAGLLRRRNSLPEGRPREQKPGC